MLSNFQCFPCISNKKKQRVIFRLSKDLKKINFKDIRKYINHLPLTIQRSFMRFSSIKKKNIPLTYAFRVLPIVYTL